MLDHPKVICNQSNEAYESKIFFASGGWGVTPQTPRSLRSPQINPDARQIRVTDDTLLLTWPNRHVGCGKSGVCEGWEGKRWPSQLQTSPQSLYGQMLLCEASRTSAPSVRSHGLGMAALAR